MALLKATRSAQYVKEAEFSFNWDDTMVNASGVSDDFKTVASHAFDIINLPQGAVVLGGEVVTTTAFTGSTAYNVIVGDADSTNRYLGTTDKTTAARTALVPTGYVGTGQNIRLTVTPTVATVTAGAITVRVQYVIPGCANEVVPN